jgi:hypothetical protein
MPSRRLKKRPEFKERTLLLSDTIHTQLRLLSKHNHRSMSGMVSFLIERECMKQGIIEESKEIKGLIKEDLWKRFQFHSAKITEILEEMESE